MRRTVADLLTSKGKGNEDMSAQIPSMLPPALPRYGAPGPLHSSKGTQESNCHQLTVTPAQAQTRRTQVAHMSPSFDWLSLGQKWTCSKRQAASDKMQAPPTTQGKLLAGDSDNRSDPADVNQKLEICPVIPRGKRPLCFCLVRRSRCLLV